MDKEQLKKKVNDWMDKNIVVSDETPVKEVIIYIEVSSTNTNVDSSTKSIEKLDLSTTVI